MRHIWVMEIHCEISSVYDAGMSDQAHKPTRWRWPWAAVLLIALVVHGYVVSYFAASTHVVMHIGQHRAHYRTFPNYYVRVAYWPMAWAECKVRKESVALFGGDWALWQDDGFEP